MRKLRVLIENVPANNPIRWHHTDGKPWTTTDQLLWLATWAQAVAASSLAGVKKGESVFKNMPEFPWTKNGESDLSRLGSLDGVDQDDVLDYLDSL